MNYNKFTNYMNILKDLKRLFVNRSEYVCNVGLNLLMPSFPQKGTSLANSVDPDQTPLHPASDLLFLHLFQDFFYKIWY